MSSELKIDIHEHVMWLTIDRPARRNAVTWGVVQDLTAAIDDANHRRNLRAIVLTGSGNSAFCAGADLQNENFRYDYANPHSPVAQLFRRAHASNVPLLARVNGDCLASGMGLLAMCDLAVSADHAKFGLPEARIGLFPAQVLSVLQHLIGRRKLVELCLCAEPIDALEAKALGLVNEVAADVDKALDILLGRVLNNSPTAIRRGLYLMKRMRHLDFEASVSFAEGQIGLLALSEDAHEGQEALRDGRAPRFTGL